MSQLPPGFVLDTQPQGQPLPAPPVSSKPMDEGEAIRIGMERERLDIARREAAAKAEKDAADAAERDAKALKAESAKTDAIAKAKRVLDQIDAVALDSADNGGWFETGLTGSIAGNIKGTAAYDLRGAIKTIDANSAFGTLQAMRDASPTGGALGNVTEKELDLLKSSVANLDPDQSQGQFISSLSTAKRAWLDILAKLDPAAAEEYKTKPGIRFRDNGEIVLTKTQGPDDREAIDVFGTPPNDGGSGGGGNVSFKGVPLLEGDYSPSSLARGFGAGVGDIVQGAGDMAGILGANLIGQGLYNAMGINRRYDAGEVMREASGLPDNPDKVVSQINRFATGALTGSALARGLATVAQPGAVQNALSTLGKTPVRDTVAGGAAGAGAYAGEKSGVPGGELIGALAGGVGGYKAADTMVNALAPKSMSNLGQAAARQGVELLPADTGGGAVKALTTGAKASPLSVQPIMKQAQRNVGQLEQAASRTAQSAGGPVTTDVAGEAIRSAGKRYVEGSRKTGNALYERAYNQAGNVKTIKPRQTIAAIDQELARLAENPAGEAQALAKELTALKESIKDGVSIRGLRDARTSFSQGVYDGKLRSSGEQAMYQRILANVGDDIDAGLRSVGKDKAADAFKRADAFWSGRVEQIDNVLQPILGKDGQKGGEQIVASIESMARGQLGGNARLSRLLKEMTPKEAQGVRATLIDRMGKAAAGQQDETGQVFSSATFLTNWNKMTPQAKASIFSNKEMRKNLDDIATIAAGMKRSQALANTSNTGIALGANITALGGGAMAVGPIPAALLGGGQFLTGKLLASPRIANFLAKAPKTNAVAPNLKYTERLGKIAAQEPLIAGDVKALQQELLSRFQAGPSSLAAQDADTTRTEQPR